MMKYRLSLALLCGILVTNITSAQSISTQKDKFTDPNYNKAEKVLNTNDLTNPIRQGTTSLWSGVENIIFEQPIGTSQEATNQTLAFARNLINYALAMVSLVALVYMLYHGFLVFSAAGDNNQYKKGLTWVKYALYALLWMWISRFIISMIYRVLGIITNTDLWL